MTAKERFTYEMMDTVTLAYECARFKCAMREHLKMKKLYRHSTDNKIIAHHNQEYRRAKVMHYQVSKILKSRQLRLI